ncbi:F-box/kelch-repeat protein At5g43190-like [Aristolochia californica]|uniref:F-box/kelch-repeat protein At5g43190-like n=1 Tax=Aristolochia californica TaxID=171875 RepID=UPI0035D84CBC
MGAFRAWNQRLRESGKKMMTSVRSPFFSPARTSPPEMEPRIWSYLPQHLLELILAQLPLRTLIGIRSTCKHFNSLLSSPSFLSLLKSRAPFLSSYLLLSHPQFPLRSYSLYEPILGRWRKLELPFPVPVTCGLLNLISSSNGLLCFSTSGSFLVANLLTRSCKVIESPLYSFTSATLISTNSYPSGFKLCLISESSNLSSSVFVYDSRDETWRKFEGYGSFLRHNSHQQGVFSNGCLYFVLREPFSVVGFDLRTWKWERPITELPPDLTFVRLVSSGEEGTGKLYLIGGVGTDGISRSLSVWELGGDGREWILLEALPGLMCKKFVSVCYHNYDHVYCFWHEGRLSQESLIGLCCYTWPEVLVYKVARRTWHWVPRCPSLPEKSSCGFRWFSFVPNLYASV